MSAEPQRPNRAVAFVDEFAPTVGSYLTDEVFLYRVAGRVVTDALDLVDLEDCYGLDVVRIHASVLREGRLRVVM